MCTWIIINFLFKSRIVMFAAHFFKTIHTFDEFVYRWDHNIVPHYHELMEMIENPQWYSINEIVSKANQYAELAQNYYKDALKNAGALGSDYINNKCAEIYEDLNAINWQLNLKEIDTVWIGANQKINHFWLQLYHKNNEILDDDYSYIASSP